MVRAVLEHLQDLGRMGKGEPASIWQLPQLRSAFGDTAFVCVAGHQCQFPGVGRKKPTRLMTDILAFEEFGHVAWPKFDAREYYLGPLPRVCGHNHKQAMIGRGKDRGFNMSPRQRTPRECAPSSQTTS